MPKRRRTRRRLLRGGASDFDIFLDWRKHGPGARYGYSADQIQKNAAAAQKRLEAQTVRERQGFWSKAMNTLAKPAEWVARRVAGDDAVNNIKNAAEKGDIKGMVKGSVEGAVGTVKRLQGEAAGKGRRRKKGPKRTIRRRRK